MHIVATSMHLKMHGTNDTSRLNKGAGGMLIYTRMNAHDEKKQYRVKVDDYASECGEGSNKNKRQ